MAVFCKADIALCGIESELNRLLIGWERVFGSDSGDASVCGEINGVICATNTVFTQ